MIFYFRMHFCYSKQRVLALTLCRISLGLEPSLLHLLGKPCLYCLGYFLNFHVENFHAMFDAQWRTSLITNMHDDLEPFLECAVHPASCISIPLLSAGVSKAFFVPSSVADKVVKHDRSPAADPCGTPPVSGGQGIAINQLVCPHLFFQTVIS